MIRDKHVLRRDEQKLKTRQALLDAALELVEASGSLASLSLREVTRAAGVVPTAFYRHFGDMDELGLALVDESFRTLRVLMREARSGTAVGDDPVRRSVDTMLDFVRLNHRHFQFIAREMVAGSPRVRAAIRAEVRLVISELATDLGRLPPFIGWQSDDLHMVASLLVGAMLQVTQQLLELGPGHADEAQRLRDMARKQLRLVLLGANVWRGGR